MATSIMVLTLPVLLYRTKLRHTKKATYFTKMVKFFYSISVFVFEANYTVEISCVDKMKSRKYCLKGAVLLLFFFFPHRSIYLLSIFLEIKEV